MNNSRFSLNGKQKLFPISEDCLILNIYSPAKATTKARKPVCSPEGPVHPLSSILHFSPFPFLSPNHSKGPENALG